MDWHSRLESPRQLISGLVSEGLVHRGNVSNVHSLCSSLFPLLPGARDSDSCQQLPGAKCIDGRVPALLAQVSNTFPSNGVITITEVKRFSLELPSA